MTFTPNGWFLSKLDLVLHFIYWTIHFLFDEGIASGGAGRRGVDYYLELVGWLGKDVKTEAVCDIFL